MPPDPSARSPDFALMHFCTLHWQRYCQTSLSHAGKGKVYFFLLSLSIFLPLSLSLTHTESLQHYISFYHIAILFQPMSKL